MSEIDPTLADNYRGLAAERGTSLPAMAGEYEEHSPGLAAWMRAQAAGDAPEARTEKPKGRRAAADKVTAEAAPAETEA